MLKNQCGHDDAARSPIVNPLVRIVRWTLMSCYLLFMTSFLFFLLIEAHPPILELLNPGRVPYYAIKASYEVDDQLVFVKRARKYEWITGLDDQLQGGDAFTSLPAKYQDSIRKWPYRASYTKDGFRTNSGEVPFEIAVIGDSFIEFGESDQATLSEELVARTGLSAINLGLAWYGPHQYLQLFARYIPILKPRVAVVALFAGNDIRDIIEYENWQRTGAYHQFGGDQGRNIVYRYYAAMRDVLTAVKVMLTEIVSRKFPSFISRSDSLGTPTKNAPFSPADFEYTVWASNVGIIKFHESYLPMVFSYWDPTVAEPLHTSGWQSLEGIIATIEDIGRRSNVRVIWLVIPTKTQVYGRQALSTGSGIEFERLLLNQLKVEDDFSNTFANIAARLELEYLDLLPIFRQLAPDCLLFYPSDSHWNRHGRRVAAAVLSSKLQRAEGETEPFDGEFSNVSADYCGRTSEYYN